MIMFEHFVYQSLRLENMHVFTLRNGKKTEIPTEPNSSAVNMNILPEVNLHSYVN